MSQITPNLALTVWNNLSDPYDSSQLVDNFVKIDLHDHSGGGKGKQINGSTGIQSNTIGSDQIGTNQVTADELRSSSSDDGLRSVTANHIKNSTITKAKLDSTTAGSYVVPKYIAAGSSLPSGSSVVAGDEVYYQASSGSSTSPLPNVVWHLRWNGTVWDFLGGTHLYNKKITNVVSSGSPTEGSAYTGWGAFGGTGGSGTGGSFNNILAPLPGKYKVDYDATLSMTTNAGIFSVGAHVGAVPTTTTTVSPNVGLSYAYYSTAYSKWATSNSFSEADIVASTGATSRYVNLVAGISSWGSNAAGVTTVQESRLALTPMYIYGNWS
jgi:hypothetical protein